MENLTDALKIVLAVFAFVLALSVAILMFSQLNETSKIILHSSDITNYYEYEIATNEEQSRIVGLETIIPTLYKYYKENYTVLFLNVDGKPLPLYKSQTNVKGWAQPGIIGKYYTADKNRYASFDNNSVCSFDVDEETLRYEPWTGSTDNFKKNLDAFLYGGEFKYPSGIPDSQNRYGYTYPKDGFVGTYSKRKFKEMLGEYNYSLKTEDEIEGLENELTKGKKKRVIIYQLQR